MEKTTQLPIIIARQERRNQKEQENRKNLLKTILNFINLVLAFHFIRNLEVLAGIPYNFTGILTGIFLKDLDLNLIAPSLVAAFITSAFLAFPYVKLYENSKTGQRLVKALIPSFFVNTKIKVVKEAEVYQWINSKPLVHEEYETPWNTMFIMGTGKTFILAMALKLFAALWILGAYKMTGSPMAMLFSLPLFTALVVSGFLYFESFKAKLNKFMSKIPESYRTTFVYFAFNAVTYLLLGIKNLFLFFV